MPICAKKRCLATKESLLCCKGHLAEDTLTISDGGNQDLQLSHWKIAFFSKEDDGTSKRRVKKLGTWILSFSSTLESRAAHLKGLPLRWAALDSCIEEKLRIHVPSFFTLLLLVPSLSQWF